MAGIGDPVDRRRVENTAFADWVATATDPAAAVKEAVYCLSHETV